MDIKLILHVILPPDWISKLCLFVFAPILDIKVVLNVILHCHKKTEPSYYTDCYWYRGVIAIILIMIICQYYDQYDDDGDDQYDDDDFNDDDLGKAPQRKVNKPPAFT